MQERVNLIERGTDLSEDQFHVYTPQQIRELQPQDISYDIIQLKSNLDTSIPCGFSKSPGRRD